MSEGCRGLPASEPQTYAKLEETAMQVRCQVLGDRNFSESLPGVALFENLDRYTVKVSGKSIRLSYAVETLPGDIEARTYFEPQRCEIVVALDEETYEMLAVEHTRARFSLFHEIGHAVLHPKEMIDISSLTQLDVSLMRNEIGKYPVYYDTEWQANAFAGALLMPAKGLFELEQAGELTVKKIMATFGVSRQAAGVRLAKYQEKGSDMLKM